MRQKFHVKKGDLVVVTTGSHKGKKGEITSVVRETHRVIVKGVNVVKRHMRPTPANPNGVLEKELSIHISNVTHVDPSTKAPAKVGVKFDAKGNKLRFFRKSGKELG